MIPRISKMEIQDDYVIYVEFDDGHKVMYDVKEDINTLPGYQVLAEECGLFKQARIDSSRTCVYWNEEIDLPSDSIYEYGTAL